MYHLVFRTGSNLVLHANRRQMTDVFGNPLIHESAQFSYLYHATAHRHGSDQSDREPTMAMHCLDILDYVIFESGFL